MARNASGRKWSSGPYVRKSERKRWDRFYKNFVEELKHSRNYPEGAALLTRQIDVLAYNLAYLAIWELR